MINIIELYVVYCFYCSSLLQCYNVILLSYVSHPDTPVIVITDLVVSIVLVSNLWGQMPSCLNLSFKSQKSKLTTSQSGERK